MNTRLGRLLWMAIGLGGYALLALGAWALFHALGAAGPPLEHFCPPC